MEPQSSTVAPQMDFRALPKIEVSVILHFPFLAKSHQRSVGCTYILVADPRDTRHERLVVRCA